MPSIEALKEATSLADRMGKRFTYATPRVTNDGLQKIANHFAFLDRSGTYEVVTNRGFACGVRD